jgi:hypothetical protein
VVFAGTLDAGSLLPVPDGFVAEREAAVVEQSSTWAVVTGTLAAAYRVTTTAATETVTATVRGGRVLVRWTYEGTLLSIERSSRFAYVCMHTCRHTVHD